jgi:hypothetical protein
MRLASEITRSPASAPSESTTRFFGNLLGERTCPAPELRKIYTSHRGRESGGVIFPMREDFGYRATQDLTAS